MVLPFLPAEIDSLVVGSERGEEPSGENVLRLIQIFLNVRRFNGLRPNLSSQAAPNFHVRLRLIGGYWLRDFLCMFNEVQIFDSCGNIELVSPFDDANRKVVKIRDAWGIRRAFATSAHRQKEVDRPD